MFDIQSPAAWVADKIKEGVTNHLVDYISALPIILGVSIGVYALVSMISKTLAKLGVVGVFIYGGLVAIT